VLFLALFAIILIATYAYFLPANGQFGAYYWLGALIPLLICAGLWRLGFAQPRGRLRFDGREWWRQPDGAAAEHPVHLELALDLQSHMLLRCHNPALKQQAQWMCISHRNAALDWPLFRRAVYWRATPLT
jgi:hypothetical protein